MRSLVSAFAGSVAAAPDAVAVAVGGLEVSYAELDRWSDGVCSVLLRAGVRPGGLVGLSMRQDAGVVAAILGILKTGCGYVPLDPGYPVARLEFMAADAGLDVVLVDGTGPAVLGEGRRLVEMPGAEVDVSMGAVPPVPVTATAYVIYTSGSTGRPKGVPIRHSEVLALFDATGPLFAFGPSDRWSLFHSYSFDFSVWEIWGPLLSGGRIVPVPEVARVHPRSFTDLLREEGITVLSMVPSAFRHLVAGAATDLPAVKHLVFGGEPLDPGTVEAWMDGTGGIPAPAISNMYGITETTVHVTHRRVTDEDLRRVEAGTVVGHPLSHLSVLLLDETGRPVPPGVEGEIHVAGAGLSPGYLGLEDLNRERFPELVAPDGVKRRYFRSGDSAAWSGDGRGLVFRGRLDDQVQFRGFRIELGEIESVLRARSDIVDVVVVVEDEGAQADLVAYVVAHGALAVRDVRKELLRWLPRHMVPARIVVLDELPRTASGKLDRLEVKRSNRTKHAVNS